MGVGNAGIPLNMLKIRRSPKSCQIRHSLVALVDKRLLKYTDVILLLSYTLKDNRSFKDK